MRELALALAERQVMVPYPPPTRGGYFALDPRFAALRGEHEWTLMGEFMCRRCGAYSAERQTESPRSKPAPFCLRTDLGSIVRAAAACGEEALDAVLVEIGAFARIATGEQFEENLDEVAIRALTEAVS